MGLKARSISDPCFYFGLMTNDPHEFPIDGILDLHMFQPDEVKDLVPEYLAECRKRGILQVRIIHGKGTGTLRRTVQSIVEKLPSVKSFRPADQESGGWGAMIVTLKGMEEGLIPKINGRKRNPSL
jgi:DNA-nicking Smr family endonuclease